MLFRSVSQSRYQVVGYGFDESSNTKDFQSISLEVGSYYIYATTYNIGGSPSVFLYGAYSDDIITIRFYERKTNIAEGGIYSFLDKTSYLYFKQKERFKVSVGGIIDVTHGSASIGVGSIYHNMSAFGHILSAGQNWLNIHPTLGFRKSTDGGNTWNPL